MRAQIAVLALALALPGCSKYDEPTTPTRTIGSDVRLTTSSGDVVLCSSDDARREFTRLAVANDLLGMARMEMAGQIFRVPSGTAARIIGSRFDWQEVRIMEGAHFGRSGWAPRSMIE